MAAEETKPQAPEHPAKAEEAKTVVSQPRKRRRWLLPVIVLLVVIALVLGIPKVLHALNTVSTDDAYVNSYVTFVAPRVSGQVARVRVEDNNRVKKGDVLVQLDAEPYQVQVAIKQAAVDSAQAELVVAEATARGDVAQTRSARFKLIRTIEDVDNQVAIIRARVATWEQTKATLVLAQAEFERAEHLIATKVVSAEEYDQKRETLDVAKAQVQQALENIYEARAALGLPAEPPAGSSLADVPAKLDQSFSSVRQALADLLQNAAKLGVTASSYNLTPKQVIEEFYRRDPGGDIDRIYADVVQNAPDLKKAQASLMQAQRDLDQAKLDLRYCTIVAEIDGVVTRRNVNPGNNVQVGQSLMAIRSLSDIWVDANFKETQLRDLRIGLPVDLRVDMYGSTHVFKGRISGFTEGTGSTLALLPPENATGNFIKVVQRLPVRIDLVDYNADQTPLFIGTSVVPYVYINKPPTGPDAGKFLQTYVPQSYMKPSSSPGPTASASG